MIEQLSDARCVRCDICVRVCPMNVFEAVDGQTPVIARQADCQTCFLCEAYCPADALFVAPLSTPAPADSPYRQESALATAGAYRQQIGWGPGRTPGSARDTNHLFTARIRP